jgi:tRNA threonylcarbamoyladenosine biosynthesis protein TsaB
VILAIDTTSEFGSMALVDESGRVAGELPVRSPDGFSHVLYGRLRSFLDAHALRLNDISCFACAAGPGSFTGVRVGMAAIKGLAEATGKPATAVSNLQALAYFGELPLRATLLDARRGEIFGAVYNDALEIVRPEVVMKLDDWVATLPKENIEFVSNQTFPGIALREAPRELAAAIGKIAWQRLQRGEAGDPALLDANYVRRSDAELFWKDSK